MRQACRFFPTILLAALGGMLVGAEFQPAKSLRRPITMALSADESLLYVANRDSGTLTVMHAKKLRLLDEAAVGKRLSAVARLGAEHLLVCDEATHELILLKAEGTKLVEKSRLSISPYPADVVITPGGTKAYVSSLWSRRVSVVELGDEFQMSVAATIDLPFAPDKLLHIEDENMLIVADHFGGRLGIVDCDRNELTAVRTFFAENIRGMGIDPRSGLLAVSHTMLNEYAHTVRNDVHWGVLMSNDLRWLQLPQVLDPEGDFYNKGHMHPLGEPNMGGADPGELAFFGDGTIVVPLAGVDKVAFGKEGDFGMHRLQVGRCPTTVTASDRHRRAYVANTFDDTISVIDIDKKKVIAEVSLGPQRELTVAERGEILFRDGKLSHDGWMTCHTCHTSGHTNGGLNDNFSDKSFGAPKQVLSLLGAKDTAPYAWNGQAGTLAEQIRKSNKITMQGPEISEQQVDALAAYVRTLKPPPSVDQLRGTADAQLIARGAKLFSNLNCANCHAPPHYTTEGVYDVGLHDKQGNTEFNPPSLRGVGQRGPYFHDGSAAQLEDVFSKYGHQLNEKKLTGEELRELAAYLRSL